MSEQVDTKELRKHAEFYFMLRHQARVDIEQAADELDTLRTIIANEARDWSEAHDALLAATGTVVDAGNVTGQPTVGELVGRLAAERAWKETSREMLKVVTERNKEQSEDIAKLTAERDALRDRANHFLIWFEKDGEPVDGFKFREEWQKLHDLIEHDAFMRELLPPEKGTDDAPSA